MRRTSKTRFLAAAGALAVIAPAVPATADPASGTDDLPATPPWLLLEDGVSAAQFSLDDAIEESIYVETTVDSDLDGELDRVHLRLSRPGETETEGIKVPVIFEHSPYRFGVNGAPNHDVDLDALPQETLRHPGTRSDADAPGSALSHDEAVELKGGPNLPGPLDNYWVPRGYAVVLGESIGTAFSDGCPTIGDMKETLATKAIIDWLNGRAKAWNEDGRPVTADWSTGDVGMVGTSYNGTLPNMVATTGVEGLRTIVPVSAISSWYDYYRANGLVRAPHSGSSGRGTNFFQGEDLDVLAIFTQGESRFDKCAHITEELLENQDRETGDYSPYWHERDYLHRADGVEASVFVVHGLEDYNVMPRAFASWWEQLARYDVPRKIWLHKDGHGGPRGATDYQLTLNRWFDHWLFGVDNGIMDEPRADVQRPDGTYVEYADWPVPGASGVTLHLAASDPAEPGALSLSGNNSGVRQSFVDAGREFDTDTELLPNPDEANPNRLVYLTDELPADVHLSGTSHVRLRASVDNRNAANLTAVLVDYGPAGSDEEPVMLTRGWMDPQNRISASSSLPIKQGKEYWVGWDLEPDDYVFPAGHRIGLVVVSTDHDYTIRPLPGTQLTVNPGLSTLELPLAGGL
ncbi:MAG TPA: Xaa-Pro dipeptidyl-peptidase [Jiangellaceae bacterium]